MRTRWWWPVKIKHVVDQRGRDITAVYVCEHCGHESVSYGYDTEHWRVYVVPSMQCMACWRVSPVEDERFDANGSEWERPKK